MQDSGINLSEGGVKIKRFIVNHVAAIGLIFGIACIATDDTHVYSVKPLEPKINQQSSLTGSRTQPPARLQIANNSSNFNSERTRMLNIIRSIRDGAAADGGKRPRNQSISDVEQKNGPADRSRYREVTAYNAGDPAQNYGDPCEAANGEDICAALDSGFKRCAANFVPFGTLLHIAHYGVCTVTDRMNKRYRDRVDIAMKKHEKQKALQFGRRRLKVTVLATREG
jgi:3D (Asp-Asp-Asp) domain-containing protein